MTLSKEKLDALERRAQAMKFRHYGELAVNADDLLSLIAAARELENRRWIPVAERLPEEGTLCVILGEHWSGHPTPPELVEREGPTATGVWRRFLADETDDEVPLYVEDNVTHWVPLPSAPEQTKEEANG